MEARTAIVTGASGGIHALVNNAGAHEGAPFEEESAELWENMYRTNVLGTVLPSQAVVPVMREQGDGSIVHVSSKAGVVGEPGHAAYLASGESAWCTGQTFCIDGGLSVLK
jgi:NAD(P)-dependent dehydrogenase (short-subunit alcohol dehydrogenase family)